MRIEALTTLKSHTRQLLADVARSTQPILIARNGLPCAYLIDAQSFERMQQRMRVLEGIARGEPAAAEGQVTHYAQAKMRLARLPGSEP